MIKNSKIERAVLIMLRMSYIILSYIEVYMKNFLVIVQIISSLYEEKVKRDILRDVSLVGIVWMRDVEVSMTEPRGVKIDISENRHAQNWNGQNYIEYGRTDTKYRKDRNSSI